MSEKIIDKFSKKTKELISTMSITELVALVGEDRVKQILGELQDDPQFNAALKAVKKKRTAQSKSA
ncbi:MAG: hypothetical protein HQ555_07820 [Candidatus Aminicenantes bacterium]|nr:hypothetical protein [Candidatus Aminicenantes bacterium]